ncbi:MAG: hypothetical protein ACTHN3_13810 [Solirubrobacterales bacterium]
MRRGRGAGRTVVSLGLVAACVVVVLLVKGLYPADLPESRNPDFVDNVFDNRGVLWAARLLLVSAAGVLAFGGIFIVVSIGIRMKNGEWLRRAGPFEISEGKVSQAEDEIEYWHRTALERRKEIRNLRERLRQSDELAENLRKLR